MKLFKLNTYIFAFLIIGTIFIFIKIGTPNHPTIDNKATSTEQVKTFIKKILKQEANNISFQYVDSSVPVEYIQASKIFFSNLEQCKNDKICLINEYDDFMNEWASDRLRQETRAYYMINKFGLIGEKINQSLGFMY